MSTRQQQSADTNALFERLIPGMAELVAHQRRALEQITSLNAVHTSGIQPRPLTLNSATSAAASQRLSTSAGTLRGWSLREVGGASAIVRLRSGQDVAGDLLLTMSFLANESTRDFPTHGIAYANGLYFEVVSGSIEGAVFIGPIGA